MCSVCPVFAQVVAGFRYGREDLDVLGLNFRRDLIDVRPPPSLKPRARAALKIQLSPCPLTSHSFSGENAGVSSPREHGASAANSASSSAHEEAGTQCLSFHLLGQYLVVDPR